MVSWDIEIAPVFSQQSLISHRPFPRFSSHSAPLWEKKELERKNPARQEIQKLQRGRVALTYNSSNYR